MKQRFNSFSELSRHKKEGEHYNVIIQETGGNTVIVAPHGGEIEFKTSEIAKKIAASDHSLYIFEGIEQPNSFFELHVGSADFNEPRCIELVSKADIVLTIHGCQQMEPVIYLGGRDEELKNSLAEDFNKHGVRAMTEGHPYPGDHTQNICNRNARGQGVQLEFSRGIRKDPALLDKCVEIIRARLKA